MAINDSINMKALELGKIDRRQLIQALGVAATAGLAASVAPGTAAFAASAAQMGAATGTGFKAVAYNHINYQVSDYAKVRDFYVNLFGMKCVWDDGKQCSVEFGDPQTPFTSARSRGPSIGRPAPDPMQTGRSRWGKATSINWRSRSRIFNWIL